MAASRIIRGTASSPDLSIATEEPNSGDPYLGLTFEGRYQILSKLGEGSQARIYVAQHLLIDRPVAIKCLLPLLAAEKGFVERFLNEGRAAGALGHPNIVESLDMGLAPDGAPFLVFELVDGHTLSQQIDATGPFSLGRAAYIGSQIASALGAAHSRGIVHRDLKPDNVLLIHRGGRQDHVKVLDFGVSKFSWNQDRARTIAGEVLGTPGFMAPEQVEAPQGTDARADIYALGATLYHMLTGTPPFADVEFPKILTSIVDDAPRKLAELRPDLPSGAVALVERAMHRSRVERFQSMGELEEALHEFAQEPARVRSHVPVAQSIPPSATNASLLAHARHLSGSLSRPAPSGAAIGGRPSTASTEIPAMPSAAWNGHPSARRKRFATWGLGVPVALLASGLVLAYRCSDSAWDTEPRARPEPNRPNQTPPITTAESTRVEPETARTEEPANPEPLLPPSSETELRSRARPSKAPTRPPSVPPTSVKNEPTGLAPARSLGAATKPSVEPQNCTPPYYYEGKKKTFKPGCV